MIIKIDYQGGDVVSDNHIVSFLQEKLRLGKDFTIGSALMLHALRVEVKSGRYRENFYVEGIEKSVVVVEYEDELYYIKEDGKMDCYIPSLLDELLDKLLDL